MPPRSCAPAYARTVFANVRCFLYALFDACPSDAALAAPAHAFCARCTPSASAAALCTHSRGCPRLRPRCARLLPAVNGCVSTRTLPWRLLRSPSTLLRHVWFAVLHVAHAAACWRRHGNGSADICSPDIHRQPAYWFACCDTYAHTLCASRGARTHAARATHTHTHALPAPRTHAPRTPCLPTTHLLPHPTYPTPPAPATPPHRRGPTPHAPHAASHTTTCPHTARLLVMCSALLPVGLCVLQRHLLVRTRNCLTCRRRGSHIFRGERFHQ